MDQPCSHEAEDPEKLCLPLASRFKPISLLAFWAPRSLKKDPFPNGFAVKNPFSVKNSGKGCVIWEECPLFGEAVGIKMERLGEAVAGGNGLGDNGGEGDSYSDSTEEERRGSSSSSENSSSGDPQQSFCGSEGLGPAKRSEELGWPMKKKSSSSDGVVDGNDKISEDDAGVEKQKRNVSEIEMMKERFSKLLLGEDMSGCGKGVCTALAISNAITNLCATIFGQLWRLEPLPPQKKSMWQREMEWLVCVSDHIVELIPTWQTFPDGTKLEVMTCRPRSDLYANLPALRKLDNMLLEILGSFSEPEFWYVDQGISAPDCDGSASFRRAFHRHDEKWWLPVPRVPPGGLSESTRKELQHKRECANQILKAAMAINNNALAEIEVPESYLESLPKNGRASLGDLIYRYITSDQFSPECLLDCLDLSSEHHALEIANRVEASMYIWRRRTANKPMNNTNRNSAKSSWGMVKDMIVDAEKRELLAERAEGLLLCLKQRFPGLTQTTLDMSKIQFNKDVGKSILESYSRVLESLASNIVARIDDLLYVDDLSKHTDQFSSIVHNKVITSSYSVPVSGTPFETAYATPSFSPAPGVSPVKGEKALLLNRKLNSRGFGVKKVLTEYLGVEVKGKSSNNNNVTDISAPNFSRECRF